MENPPPPFALNRRAFLRTTALGAATLASGGAAGLAAPEAVAKPAYRGPNVVLIRFGGGARRRESIDPRHT